jgi:hypothetical protein
MMPQGSRWLDDAKRFLIWTRLQRVKAVFTSASEDGLPRPLLLNKKIDLDEIQERHYCHMQVDEQKANFC